MITQEPCMASLLLLIDYTLLDEQTTGTTLTPVMFNLLLFNLIWQPSPMPALQLEPPRLLGGSPVRAPQV